MFELSLGIILAVCFVASYWLYRKAFSRDDDAPWTRPIINAPDARQLAENRPPLFLPAAEMSEHHAGGRPDETR